MTLAEVSVVIPARNAENTILHALESVLGQTSKPLEVIVVDDQSQDSTVELVRSFGSGVRLLQGQGHGAGPARNLGIEAAKGEYIAFLDADDIWEPEKLELQLAIANPNTVVATYASYVTGNEYVKVGTSIRTRDDSTALEYCLSGKGVPAILSTWVIHREALLEIGMFNPIYKVAQDYDLLLRLLNRGLGLSIIRSELVRYRLHISSETASAYHQQFLTAKYLVELHCGNRPTLDFARWMEVNGSDRQLARQAKAGFELRQALISRGRAKSKWFFFKHLLCSLALDPKRFLHKIFRQSSIAYWRRLR